MLSKPVYLLWGEEWYLINQQLERFVNLIPAEVRDFNLDLFDEQTVSYSELKTAISTLPILCEQRLVILKNSKLLGTARKHNKTGITIEQLLQILDELNPTSCLLILAEGKIDKRKKAYKLILERGEVQEYGQLKREQLLVWLNNQFEERGKKITKDAAQLLLDSCPNCLSQLIGEIEKISLYSEGSSLVELETVNKLVAPINQESIFRLVDAVAEKRGESALRILRIMLDDNEAPLKILFMLTRQFRIVYQAKILTEQGQSSKMLASVLRQPPFVIKNCLRQGRVYTNQELKYIFELLLEADSAIKTGKYHSRLAIELLVAKLVGNSNK